MSLFKPMLEILVPGTPGQDGQTAVTECPPPPPPGPGTQPPAPPNTGGGMCPPDAETCCVILMLPNQYGVIVPTLVCT